MYSMCIKCLAEVSSLLAKNLIERLTIHSLHSELIDDTSWAAYTDKKVCEGQMILQGRLCALDSIGSVRSRLVGADEQHFPATVPPPKFGDRTCLIGTDRGQDKLRFVGANSAGHVARRSYITRSLATQRREIRIVLVVVYKVW